MTPSEFTRLFDVTITELRMLATVKGGEYATDADRLANFRDAARRTRMSPAQVLLLYLDKHYAAISNYICDEAAGIQRARSAPIEGRVNDMIVYLILYKALLSEARSVARAVNADDGPRLVWDGDADSD